MLRPRQFREAFSRNVLGHDGDAIAALRASLRAPPDQQAAARRADMRIGWQSSGSIASAQPSLMLSLSSDRIR
jgi:hypothetical protein